jgi:hypothetical protein
MSKPKHLTRRFNWSAPCPADAIYNLAISSGGLDI